MARALAVIKEDARALLLLNLVAFVILAATGAGLINDAIDAGYMMSAPAGQFYYWDWTARPAASADQFYYQDWTAASGFANLFATVAGLVGAAAAFPGLHHVRAWSQGSLPPAAHAGFMAWLLTLLALGLAIKEIIMGATVHDYKLGSTTEIFLGDKHYLAFAILRAVLTGLLSVTQLCYLRTIFHTLA